MAAFGNAISNSLSSKVAEAATADNALALNGQTASQILATTKAFSDAHIAATGNPHGTTAADIGAYSRAEVESKLDLFIPKGILPISSWGILGSNPGVYVSDAGVVFPNEMPIIFNGAYYVLQAQTVVNTTGLDTFAVYARLVNGVPTYITAGTGIPDSNLVMYLGTVVSAASKTIDGFLPVARIDRYRPSATPRGSSFPVVAGPAGRSVSSIPWS